MPPYPTLLLAHEPPAFSIQRPDGASDFVLTCDHASRRIPHRLHALGLVENELSSHIAWDIGAASVARILAEALDAALIVQNYSRLVIDCNRPLAAPDSIPIISEWVPIPANERLSPGERAARVTEIFSPYHAAVRALLNRRHDQLRPAVLVAVHSFTPSYRSVARPWHIGLMYRDARLAHALLPLLRADDAVVVGDNQPYSITDATDYSLPLHGEVRGIAHVGIEIRQDLIATDVGQKAWAQRLAEVLIRARSNLEPPIS